MHPDLPKDQQLKWVVTERVTGIGNYDVSDEFATREEAEQELARIQAKHPGFHFFIHAY